jgi:hypothetical protein
MKQGLASCIVCIHCSETRVIGESLGDPRDVRLCACPNNSSPPLHKVEFEGVESRCLFLYKWRGARSYHAILEFELSWLICVGKGGSEHPAYTINGTAGLWAPSKGGETQGSRKANPNPSICNCFLEYSLIVIQTLGGK